MEISLIFPPNSIEYKDIVWSDKEIPQPPQTAPVELAAYINQYSPKTEILSISPEKPTRQGFEQRTDEEILAFCENSDIVGFTCLFTNQEYAQNLAKRLKEINPAIQIVLGGPNVSNRYMAKRVLEKTSIDYVVIGDGEEALLALVEEKQLKSIPNLAYRRDNKIIFNPNKNVNLNSIPIWDPGDSLDGRVILETYYNRNSELYRRLIKTEDRTPGEIGVFSRKGCAKASGELGNKPGLCNFCTSGRNPKSRVMNPRNFWRQILFLYDKYGLQDFFIADNIFGVNLEEVIGFENVKRDMGISDDINFRAYSYPSVLLGENGIQIAQSLRRIGITNIFLGVENFDKNILARANKEYVSPEQVSKSIEILGNSGIDTYLPLLLGLLGESNESLELNKKEFKKLIKKYGKTKTGLGGLVRLDISPAMPTVGTSWFMKLLQNIKIQEEYLKKTGKTFFSITALWRFSPFFVYSTG